MFLKLHPYNQHSLKKRGTHKFQLKFFGPFKILEKIEVVAYKPDLPPTALIHPTVHVSQQKLAHGNDIRATALPDGFMRPNHREQEYILERKMVCRGNRDATKVLVKWKNVDEKAATWVFLDDMHRKYKDADLEDKIVV